jgi:hypothetical protein
MITRCLRILALAAIALTLPAAAHHGATPEAAKGAPGPNAQAAVVTGSVAHLVVENRVTGTSYVFPTFAASDGRNFLLSGPGADGLLPGDSIVASGKTDGSVLFPESVNFVAASAAAATAMPATTVEGTLRLGHADNFDGTPSEFFFAVVSSDGRHTRIALATLLGVLENGMQVAVRGNAAGPGEMTASQIDILALPTEKPKSAALPKSAPVTTNYLVLPIKFPTGGTGTALDPWVYGADPFTAATLAGAVFGPTPTSNVKAFYNEVSYGQQLLSGVVADNGSGGFLLAAVAKPATCDINVIATAAEAAATARGYNVASFTGILYVFNNVSGCGWSGLAYIGWARAYSNNTTNLLVIGHELGHNFGLAHAASLDCGANVIGGTCSSSEYGDPFDTMGNNRAMHFNSMQKDELGWLPANSVASHTTGTATYTLAPLESAGGTTYAVKVAAAANRVYWIEYRQAIGFDTGMSAFPNNGAQIRVASPFESLCSGCYDDTEFLDMTPATAAFTDGALVVGQSYTDSTYNFTVNVTAATSSLLTLQVVTPPGAATSTALTAAPNPSLAGGYVLLTATVTGAGASPIGTVAFTDGASTIANCSSVALSAAGVATCYAYLPAAGSPHAIKAAYSGSIGYSGSSATVSQVVNKASTKTTVTAHTPNPVNVGSPLAVTTSLTVTSPGGGTPTGTITVSDGSASCFITLPATGCSLVPLTAGTKTLTATYAGDINYITSTSAGVSHTVNNVVLPGTFTAVSGDAQSAHVGAAFATVLKVRVLDASSNPVVGSPVTWSAPAIGARASLSSASTNTDAQGYAQITATASAISGAYSVTATNAGRNLPFTLTNTLTSSALLACAAATATVQDLIEQEYQALLQRPSDAGGKTYWAGEAARLCPLGIDPKQTFLVLGNAFLNSGEYLGLNRTDVQFVTDVYVAFLNRMPDAGGATYWTGLLGSGLPRNVVLNSFLFGSEFNATMQSLFGTGVSRSEVYTIVDLYGGILRRLPDDAGFNYWQTQFRAAQCSGPSAVYASVNSITQQFLGSAEYLARNRTNSEYVADLYYAFLRRGGDLAGFNYWVGLLNGGSSRENLRQQFLASAEMQARIAQVAGETCLH